MRHYFIILFSIISLFGYSQGIEVKGNVIDATDKQPMIGLTVMIKGTTVGTITDFGGNYILPNVSSDAIIVYSMIGYKSQEISVAGKSVINVVMKDDVEILDEVVVIGYGAVKKSDLTSSITAVKGEDITDLSTGNAMNALQGKISGVQISSNGTPGSTPRVIIRGVTTVNGSNPLYVVDGMPVGDNINFLDQNDIESMQVLKDASASAIYGTRGSNGVILITTKKGKSGVTKFNFTASVGFQTLKKTEMAKASEYEYVMKARYYNDGSIPIYNSKDDITDAEGTDWWDESVRKVALIHNYSLGFSGGGEKYTYSANIGYFGQDSQYKVGNWQKLTARFSMEYKFNSFVKAGMDITPRYEQWKNTPNILGSIMGMDPTTPVMRDQSEWTENEYDNYSRSNNNLVWNPVATMARLNSNTNEYGLLATPFISIEPIKGLVFRSQLGLNVKFRMKDDFTPDFFIDNLEKQDINEVSRTMNNWVDWNWSNTLTWMKTFNDKHNMNLMGGYTMERFSVYSLYGKREGTPTNDPLLHYVSAGTKNPDATGMSSYSSLISYLARAMYNFNGRYYITASVRIDGSSKFMKDNKYAVFPAASLAWRVTGEEFMQNQPLFSNLKLRGGWGRVGNQNISSDAYSSTMSGADYVFGSNADRIIGTTVGSMGNSLVRWETVEDYNIGLDMSFLNNRLSISAEWFHKKSHDMLLLKDNILVLGLPNWNGRMWENVGQMDAKGWELTMNWNDKKGDFSYGVGLNLSSVKNTAEKLTGAPIYTQTFNGDNIIKNEEGKEISQFYGYVADGLFQNQTEVNSHTNEHGDLLQPNAKPGDIRFKDLNNDGVVNDNDKKYIGAAFPNLMIGLNLNFSWKNIDFITNFYGTCGNDIFNSTKDRYSGANGINVYAGTYNAAWHGEGTSHDIPRLSANDANMNYKRVSSFFVEDGSYFRCKLLQIGYTLPKEWTKFCSLRLSFSAQNPFTLTNYSGLDPEAAAVGAVTESGVDNAGYPNPRTYLLGLNVKF